MLTPSLIDFADPRDAAAPRLRHAFAAPRQVLAARRLDEVRGVLDAVHAAAAAGRWCVGWLRYEAAPAFDPALVVRADAQEEGAPALAWFAVHDEPAPWPAEPAGGAAHIDWEQALPRAAFDAALAQIQQGIAAGRYYQVNYTAPLVGTWLGTRQGDARALFAALQRAQPGGYAAHIDDGAGTQVLSVSPELFFDWHAAPGGVGDILTRPMKGTAPRGDTPGQDAALAAALRASPKERAENVMIVDLLRNDLSRIAQPHSVRVPRLFHTEPLPTVWQMTSDVVARTRAGTRLADVFGALFPCGSVTGAPKVEAMRAIAALEAAPRGVYCGAVGVVRPDAAGGPGAIAATFNVPIRTVELHPGQARCGIGSGITSGATAEAEWNEWRHKRVFVDRASQPFDLLETLALVDGQLRHLADHLARLQGAAAHFNVPFDAAAVQASLQALAGSHPTGAWRVRLLLDGRGQPRAEAFALQPTPQPVRLQLADRPLAQAHSEFVRYKTTRRAHYAAFAPNAPGVFDTVLYNEAGEITETTFGNIALLLDGRWVTPPLACGLLPGVGRAVALREGRLTEAVVRLQDLPRVQGLAFVNSLRGWLTARWAS
ncbi:chorismate-binding protein [Diaphorobacter sp.]|uniref:chorismate-binding protein n=1 Tax=Diaphorobacter sp. TaxID=1934310 RepID=UPI003D12E9CA